MRAATAFRLSGASAVAERAREREEGKDDLTKGFVSPIMAYLSRTLLSNENTTLLASLGSETMCVLLTRLCSIEASLRLFPNGKI